MGRKNKHKQESAGLVGASCKATPTPPVAATATESEQPNLNSGSSSSAWTAPKKGPPKLKNKHKQESAGLAGASCKATPTPPVVATATATESNQPNLNSGSSSSTWTAPKKGRLKLNFDGSSMPKSKSRRSSIGGVYRDHTGKFVLGYAEKIGQVTSSVAELVALKRGLEFALENGWRDISIEGDFKGAVDAIASGLRFRAKKDREQYRKIAAILTRLGKTTVSHVLRKGNKVAHCFAELGQKEAAQRLWRDTPPDEVRPHIERDAAKVRSAAEVHCPCRLTSRYYPCRRPFSLRFMLQSFPNRRAAPAARQGGRVARGAKKEHGGAQLREARATQGCVGAGVERRTAGRGARAP
jgi:ribonuclease HI